MKALFKSQINIGDLIMYPLWYSIFVAYPTWAMAEDVVVKQIAVFSVPVFCYFIWCVFINIYFFYDDKIEVVYLFRFFHRKREVLFSEIMEVRYIHTAGKKEPMIVFVYQGKSFKKLLWPWNSFTHRRFKMRKDILVFLHNKNLPIIINSVFNKDKEILELTKANGSWNYQNVIDGKIIKY